MAKFGNAVTINIVEVWEHSSAYMKNKIRAQADNNNKRQCSGVYDKYHENKYIYLYKRWQMFTY